MRLSILGATQSFLHSMTQISKVIFVSVGLTRSYTLTHSNLKMSFWAYPWWIHHFTSLRSATGLETSAIFARYQALITGPAERTFSLASRFVTSRWDVCEGEGSMALILSPDPLSRLPFLRAEALILRVYTQAGDNKSTMQSEAGLNSNCDLVFCVFKSPTAVVPFSSHANADLVLFG